jgi:hypothetical protein
MVHFNSTLRTTPLISIVSIINPRRKLMLYERRMAEIATMFEITISSIFNS